MRKWVRLLFFASLWFALAAIPLPAEPTTSAILGTIKDTSGVAIPGAYVTVTHKETGTEIATVADSAGNYDVVALGPGTYEVRAEHPRFKTLTRKGIVLSADQRAVVDIALLRQERWKQALRAGWPLIARALALVAALAFLYIVVRLSKKGI